jgi:hypothetical protein
MVGWARHVAHMGVLRNAYKTFVRKTEGKRAVDIDGKIILKCILDK